MNATTSSLSEIVALFRSLLLYPVADGLLPIGVWAAKHGIKTARQSCRRLCGRYRFGGSLQEEPSRRTAGRLSGRFDAPMVTTDYLPFMERLKAEKPEAVFIFVNGDACRPLRRRSMMPVCGEAGVKLIGPGDNALDDELPNMPAG